MKNNLPYEICITILSYVDTYSFDVDSVYFYIEPHIFLIDNNLQINILDPLIKDSDEYLLKIDDLIAQHAKLVDQLAIYNNECTLIERKYQDSCNSVDAAIERRNKYANEENQDV